MTQPHEIVESNLRQAMRFFGEATGRGSIADNEGVQNVYSGLNYGVFNISMLSGPTQTDDFPSRLRLCADYYAPHAARWSFWLCENFLERSRTRDAALQRFDLHRISYAPGMLADTLVAPTRRLPKIEVVPVCDASSREAFGGVVGVSFDIPMNVVREVYYPERAWQGVYRGYLARVNGRITSIVAIVAAAGALGIYSLGTMPEDRRCGYGEALLRAALARERERTGIERVVLQSTEAGAGLYKRLGFHEVAQFSVYLTR